MSDGLVKFQGHVVEGITLDFWDTIADGNDTPVRVKARTETAREWFAKHGRDVPLETLEAIVNEFNEEWHHQWKEVHLTPGSLDFGAHLASRLGVNLKPKEAIDLERHLEEVILDLPPKPIEGAIEAIRLLQKRLPLALVCDTGISGPKMLDKLLERWNILNMFETRVYSQDVGVSKPNAVMFRTALEKMDVSASRALHIGDLEDTDIKGAHDAGMMTIRFDGNRSGRRRFPSKADLVVRSWEEILRVLGFI